MNNSLAVVQKTCWILLASALLATGIKGFLLEKSFISLLIGIVAFCSLVMLVLSYVLEYKDGKRKDREEV